MLFKPLYVPPWDLNRPGGDRRDQWGSLEGRGESVAAGLKARGLGSLTSLWGKEEVSVRPWG